MAKAKSGTFFIRRSISAATTAAQTLAIDTSAYVDPADRQGIMIEEVDFIFYNATGLRPYGTTSAQVAVQLLSGAYTDLQDYANEDMIASGGLVFDTQGGQHNAADLYPDVLATPGGRIVVDDQMTLVASVNTAKTNLQCAVLIKAKVVQLTNKDYMALALQTVAN